MNTDTEGGSGLLEHLPRHVTLSSPQCSPKPLVVLSDPCLGRTDTEQHSHNNTGSLPTHAKLWQITEEQKTAQVWALVANIPPTDLTANNGAEEDIKAGQILRCRSIS